MPLPATIADSFLGGLVLVIAPGRTISPSLPAGCSSPGSRGQSETPTVRAETQTRRRSADHSLRGLLPSASGVRTHYTRRARLSIPLLRIRRPWSRHSLVTARLRPASRHRSRAGTLTTGAGTRSIGRRCRRRQRASAAGAVATRLVEAVAVLARLRGGDAGRASLVAFGARRPRFMP
jgi:hypothetical protein